MEYIEVGARYNIPGVSGVHVPTKKALRAALSQDLTSVWFSSVGGHNAPFNGHAGNLANEGTTLTVCGPDPFRKRNWWANIKIKDGKVIMDDKPIKAVVRERETVWCEAHGDQPHFENDTCQHPHLTDQATRARMNAEAAKV